MCTCKMLFASNSIETACTAFNMYMIFFSTPISKERGTTPKNYCKLSAILYLRFADIIEICLFILWRHLEHYLLYCTPADSQDSLLASRIPSKSRKIQDSFSSDPNLDFRSGLSRVSQHDIDQLQIEATNSFGESLQKKLLDIEGLYSKVRSRYTFIQALVRRIRGLLRISRT
ncbi:UNVERIFIED_CONTAM: hypothetical protein K2H54_074448 [Gekko kuhli]